MPAHPPRPGHRAVKVLRRTLAVQGRSRVARFSRMSPACAFMPLQLLLLLLASEWAGVGPRAFSGTTRPVHAPHPMMMTLGPVHRPRSEGGPYFGRCCLRSARGRPHELLLCTTLNPPSHAVLCLSGLGGTARPAAFWCAGSIIRASAGCSSRSCARAGLHCLDALVVLIDAARGPGFIVPGGALRVIPFALIPIATTCTSPVVQQPSTQAHRAKRMEQPAQI